MYNLYLSKKKKESENSRLYMLYIYEIIFPKDVRELPVNEIYIKNDPWNLYDKFRLSLLSRELFLLHLILSVNAMQQDFLKKIIFGHENLNLFLMKKNLLCNIFVW